MIPGTPTVLARGATAFFSATFYDQAGNITEPSGAQVSLTFSQNGAETSALIEMTAPMSPSTTWTAEWDTRGIDPGQVSYSIHSEGSAIPFGVTDGQFVLTANNANLETF